MSVARTRRKLMKFERAAIRYNKLVRYDPSEVWTRFQKNTVRYTVTPGHSKAYVGVSYQKRWAPMGLREPWMLRW